MCTATEQATSGWTLTDRAGGTELDEASLVVTIGAAPAELEFTNRRDTAGLRIDKSLVGVPADRDLDDELFTLTTTCVGDFVGGTHTIVGEVSAASDLEIVDLPTGASCAVIEAADPRFLASYSLSTGVSPIGVDGGAVSITNTTGSLIVVKTTATESDLPVDLSATFTFRVECDNGLSETIEVFASLPDADGDGLFGSFDTAELGLIPAGTTCTIIETDVPEGWTLLSDAEVTVVIDPLTELAQFDNGRDIEELTVSSGSWRCPRGSTWTTRSSASRLAVLETSSAGNTSLWAWTCR